MMSNLIFFEGVSGVGKSTLSRTLSESLIRRGEAAICFLEGASDSPLDLAYAAYLSRTQYDELLARHPSAAEQIGRESIVEADYAVVRYQSAIKKEAYFAREIHRFLEEGEFCFHAAHPIPAAEYQRVFLDLWTHFSKEETGRRRTVIFDGSLFHHQINDLMRNYEATEDQIAAHLGALLQTVAPLNPVVFYLTTQDVGARLKQARFRRGQTAATAAQIAFWNRRKQTDLKMLERLSVKSHIVDISHADPDAALGMIVSRMAHPETERSH